ncbi:hypothetical protein BKA82DRAFT_4181550 [Pisolithus tinctorius]|nr:hypothetical protein BKA82DRAFT_4181550 [Pisolithus tinctorius]
MSQTMASHRAQLLLSMLPNALMYGMQEIDLDRNLSRQFWDRNAQHLSDLSGQMPGHASIEELRRTFEDATVDLRSNVQLCKLQCTNCQLLCVQSRFHDGPHNCRTGHACIHQCDFCKDGPGENRACSMICVVNAHLCGSLASPTGKFGCLNQWHQIDIDLQQVADHPDEHLCAALVHGCGELIDGSTYACPGTCRVPSDVDHTRHRCEARLCSITCQLCKRLCSHQDHMHGLEEGATHLCGEEHFCTDECSTAPYSIEATFTGRHEAFQYTKVTLPKRLKCVKSIPPGQLKHAKVVHFCQNKCENCGYFCTLPLGHPQQEHETRHGSMSRTRWVVDESDDAAALEVEGRKFSTNDEGAPMMCNLVCQAIGRHIQHIAKRLLPDPDRPKDYMTHSLFWKKSGMYRPFSNRDDAHPEPFASDAMCSGREHAGDAGTLPQPSYCTLAMFHQPSDARGAAPAIGYISKDGHHFTCQNPVIMQHAYHVVLPPMLNPHRSSSMSFKDKKPLPNTPASGRISAYSDNRLGAVLSSLYGFWSARAAAVGSAFILFNSRVVPVIENDFTSDPDQLLDAILPYEAEGGTDFTAAITSAANLPSSSFFRDGECQIADQAMQDLCRTSIRLGYWNMLQKLSPFMPFRSVEIHKMP